MAAVEVFLSVAVARWLVGLGTTGKDEGCSALFHGEVLGTVYTDFVTDQKRSLQNGLGSVECWRVEFVMGAAWTS